MLVLLLADIDECELDLDNCHVNATCADVFGSFVCTCNIGFEGDGVNCVGKTKSESVFCIRYFNIVGMRSIVMFFSPELLVDIIMYTFSCSDINECERDGANNCSGNADCFNTIGSYYCSCVNGYEGDGFICTGYMSMSGLHCTFSVVHNFYAIITAPKLW